MAFLDFLKGPLSYALGGLSHGLSGTAAQTQQVPRYAPQQQAGINQALEQALEGLRQPNQFDFSPIEQQARTQFKTRTVPSIAERFTSMGSNLTSPAFSHAIAGAGSQLEENLAALKSQYGLQQQGLNQQKLLNLLGIGLTPQFDTAFQPRQPGFGESFGVPLAQSLGQLLPILLPLLLGGLGGPIGAAGGAVAGGGLQAILNQLGNK